MDRTVIAPRKAEEKELSEKLYKSLQGLGLLHPMNEELKQMLSWDMFLKSNQPGFFQVMAYLFRVLDSAEFKRRFFWPITDKKGEANFRTATLDYLKHLNEKYQLQWANIKSYLVVMPGGLKFINFLLDFVGFVVQELIKQREKALILSLGQDFESLRRMSPKTMQKKNEFLKEFASAYVEDVEQNTALLKENLQKIKDTIAAISAQTNVKESLLLNDKFLEKFEESNKQIADEKISKPTARLTALEDQFCGLQKDMEQFQAKQLEHNQTKETVNEALRGMQYMISENQPDLEGSKVNELMRSFNKISDAVSEQLAANDHYNESNQFVTEHLAELQLELSQIKSQVAEIQKSLSNRGKELQTSKSQSLDPTVQVPITPRNTGLGSDHPFLLKYVSTPPIKLELLSGARNTQVRLSLQDDNSDANQQYETLSNNLLVPVPPRSARKGSGVANQSVDLHSTTNRSRIVDPMQLLKTINKKTSKASANQTMQPVNNLSTLGSKWKELQASFGFEETPISSRSAKSRLNLLNAQEHITTETQTESNTSLMAKKSTAMMKVIDATLNVQNLSTSPSGRLDPLVPTPCIQLNDITIINSQSLEKDDELNTNFNLKANEEDFELQNISDSVLRNISM